MRSPRKPNSPLTLDARWSSEFPPHPQDPGAAVRTCTHPEPTAGHAQAGLTVRLCPGRQPQPPPASHLPAVLRSYLVRGCYLSQITPQFSGFVQRRIIARDAEGQGFRRAHCTGLVFTSHGVGRAAYWAGGSGWLLPSVGSGRGCPGAHVYPPPTASPCVHMVSFSSGQSGARAPEQTQGCQAARGEAWLGVSPAHSTVQASQGRPRFEGEDVPGWEDGLALRKGPHGHLCRPASMWPSRVPTVLVCCGHLPEDRTGSFSMTQPQEGVHEDSSTAVHARLPALHRPVT